MKKIKNNILHSPDCDGTSYKREMLTHNSDGRLILDNVTRGCELDVIVSFSYEFEMYHLRLGRCFSGGLQEYEIVKEYIKNVLNRQVYSFRTAIHIPKWDGEDWVYEIVYHTPYQVYCIKTPIDKIPNLWQNQESLQCMRDNSMSTFLIELNAQNLAREEFISHRHNQYEITQADINKMFNKINKTKNK